MNKNSVSQQYTESFPLSREGFVTHWLISGPAVEDFIIDNPFDDQLRFEKHMRSELRDGKSFSPPAEAVPGSISALGMPWRYSGGGSRYVDVSFFYNLPVRVELYAFTSIVSGCEKNVSADLWTYAALDLWLNNEPACIVEQPVYKPVNRKKIMLSLRKGINPVFIRMQNLGVRDTRSIFTLQFHDAAESIGVTLPGPDANKTIALDLYMQSIYSEGDSIILPRDAPGEIIIEPESMPAAGSILHAEGKNAIPAGETGLSVETRTVIPEGISRVIIRGGANQKLERTLELIGRVRPSKPEHAMDVSESRREVLKRIARSGKDEDRLAVLGVLARHVLGEEGRDRPAIMASLKKIQNREDCSDFIAAGIIRLVKTAVLDQEILDKIKETFLDYRFWMDEKGSDGMCFWSENHSLLFHGAQLLAGLMYPDDYFARSGRTGREQAEIGFRRCREWLEDVSDDYFEEFLSSGYMCVTTGALLNLVDFAPEPLSGMASRVMDMLLEQLCRHVFRGSVIGPQGRVYRDVIYPFRQGTQALIHYLDPGSPDALSEWPVFFASSKYRPPENLKSLMNAEISERYSCGNGEIVLHKKRNYILTSLASPKEDPGLNWNNISFCRDSVRDSFRYTKSLNERFHGTTDFRPGVFGYQQHFWYAALSAECIAFANLPGGDTDQSSMRPGYWYGNGIFPAVKQNRNVLGAIYAIPESYPIHFTHLFFPAEKYDETRQEGNWLFARKGEAWLGIWISVRTEWHNDMLSRCELRAYADSCAYFCKVSDAEQDKLFEAFISSCLAAPPEFDEGRLLLTSGDSFALRYSVYSDRTQYI